VDKNGENVIKQKDSTYMWRDTGMLQVRVVVKVADSSAHLVG